MAIVVHIGHTRYLVDVGYGADGPTFPIPLSSGQTSTDHRCQSVKLEYKNLPQHVDPNQRVWVYSKLTKSKTWLDIYHFIDAEFFAQDFLILNGHNMTRSFFADNVVVQRFIRTDTGSFASHILVRNTLKLRDDSTEEVLEVYQNEAQRIAGLERFFQIFLSSEEISSIQGSNSELVQA
jgi:arylamine N-acetyltransferase